MHGLVFEPAGYFDDKLKRRDKKKRGDIPNPKLHRSITSKSACTTPTGKGQTNHYQHRSNSGSFNKSCSSILVDSSSKLSSPSSSMYQPTSLKTSLSHDNRNHKHNHSRRRSHQSHKSHRHSNGRKHSGSGSPKDKTHVEPPPDDIMKAWEKRLKRKKLRRTRSLNSNGVTTLLNIEKERITKDKFSRLFHDFESTKSLIDKSERDQLFRSKLAKLNEKKQKNKAISYELIRQYFTSILDKKYSSHPLAILITKFCNLFHGQYSFSPQDFKNKSIYQIVDQKRLKRKGNKRSTSDIFDDSSTGKSKVVRKTSRRLDKATEDVKSFVIKLRSLIIILYPELKVLRTYKYVVQSVFHKELFAQLTPTLGDLYSIKTEDKQSEFAKYMGMWINLTCRDFGVNDKFIEFCLIPSLRPLLLSEQIEKECDNNNTNDTVDEVKEIEIDEKEIESETVQTDSQQVSHDSCNGTTGLSKQLSKQLQEHTMSNYSQLEAMDCNEEEEEKESEIIHNAEAEDDISDDISDNILTEQTLKEFDQNYAITVLGGNGIDTLQNDNINTNFTVPEYVNEYNMELDYDDETFLDILSSGSSYRKSPNPNINDINARQKERELNNVLNVLSPTISSVSSMDGVYSLNDINDTIQSSPDSVPKIVPKVKTDNNNNNNNNNNKQNNRYKKRSSISRIFSAFSSKKKKTNPHVNSSCDIKVGINNGNDKYAIMNTATKIIDNYTGIQNQRKTPGQLLTPIKIRIQSSSLTPIKTPKISITPQNEHQENHPTPPSKRINNKGNKNKMTFKDNINNITKQMLAGSHAERIANQLHNAHRKNTMNDMNDNSNDKLDGIDETNVIKSIKDIDKYNKEIDIKIEEKEEMSMENGYIETEEDKGHNPYMSAVLEIKKMPSYDTPEDKIQCVVRTADIIRDCIDKYYENRRKDPVQITPDDLLSLFAYILTQANLHCLWAEVDLIDDFVVDNLRMDMPGYYIATLRAAMQLIVNDIEKLTDKSTKKRNSIIASTNKQNY